MSDQSSKLVSIDAFYEDNSFLQNVEAVLEAAGVVVNSTTGVVNSMHLWLGGTPNENVYHEGLTVEDCLPLNEDVIEKSARLFQAAWSHEVDSTTTDPTANLSANLLRRHQNPLIQNQQHRESITLQDVYPSVCCIKWLRVWMELNMGPDQHVSILQLLLSTKHRKGILVALFSHIQDLPVLESQMLLYCQHLQQPLKGGGTNHTTAALLEHYEKANTISSRIQEEWQQHTIRVQEIVAAFYQYADTAIRSYIRVLLGQTWNQFIHGSTNASAVSLRQVNTRAAAMNLTLVVLHRILLGVTDIVHDSYKHLLRHYLIPLHKAEGLVLWRDQMPILELYHEPLVQCIAVLLQKDRSLVLETIQALMQPDIFPATGSTSKQVLLLHEIDTYFGLLPDEVTSSHPFLAILAVVTGCMASEHSRVAERALLYFRNRVFARLVNEQYRDALRVLLPALIQREPSWNPTVRKMTYTVLLQLQEMNRTEFEDTSNRLFAERGAPQGRADEVPSRTSLLRPASMSSADGVPASASLKAGMAGWKPPGRSGNMPPPPARRATVAGGPVGKGKAPWVAGGAQPPVTITGVAPWAIQQQKPQHPSQAHKRHTVDDSNLMGLMEEPQSESVSGYQYVLKYLEQIKPADQVEGVSAWSKTQMQETPTLLPNLKFHDLVFGHELGAGAFGSVKYARLIDRTKTRSQWPEYAVKIISTEKIREMGYEASVQREIAVLRILSHPGIARLVSSFRFNEGAYLVLEYASQGDLHTLLRKHGSLDNDSTRFVVGEVVAALASIHDIGLVYGDLKPENIVITEPGHIKLTDFGGCRPITAEAKQLIGSTAKDLLVKLRDGDWKSRNNDDSDTMSVDSCVGLEDQEHDMRIEGTTAYLPPEVVLGGIPSYSADSWALGCVMYQCLTGRPPILEVDDAATRHRIVTFDTRQSENEIDSLFQEKHASGVKEDARRLIWKLLDRDKTKRPSMQQIAEDPFFSGVEVFTMHREEAYPLDVGAVSPAHDDAKWARRQFSSIWAPQPVAYDISMPDDNGRSLTFSNRTSRFSPIEEGQEGSSFFSTSAFPKTALKGVSDRIPPIIYNERS